MSKPMPQPSPELFFNTVNAYQRTAALKAAIELDMFSCIGQGRETPMPAFGGAGRSAGHRDASWRAARRRPGSSRGPGAPGRGNPELRPPLRSIARHPA